MSIPDIVELRDVRSSTQNNHLNKSTETKSPNEAASSSSVDHGDIRNNVVPPENAVEALQEWNNPPENMLRTFACFYSFFIFGMNDGAYGAMVPYLEKFYSLNYTVVSLVFLSPFAGYTLACFVNNITHVKFGQRGVAIVAPSCHLLTYVVFVFHPPYPVMVVFFIIVGFGNGLMDAAWCAWLGNMANSNQTSGILQAFYSLGAAISPLIATAMFTKGGLQWYSFYYLMVAISLVELVLSTTAFWKQTGKVYLQENPRDPSSNTGRTRQALKNKLTWILSLFVFGYVGAEVALGGWIVTFMTRVRSASPFSSGLSSTGFWTGMTIGRVGLSFLTPLIGEYRAVILYLLLAFALELIFWLVPSFIVSAVAVAFLGLVLGPLFPTAIVLATRLLPRDLHVGSIGFATAFGGSGGAIFPFVVGVVAQERGIRSLQPIILALLVVLGGLWMCLPRAGRKRDEEDEGVVGGEGRENVLVA